MRINLSILFVSSLLWLICIFLSIITLGLHIIRRILDWRTWCFLLLILFTRCWITWKGFHKGINGKLARIKHQANCVDAKNKCGKVAYPIYDSPAERRWGLWPQYMPKAVISVFLLIWSSLRGVPYCDSYLTDLWYRSKSIRMSKINSTAFSNACILWFQIMTNGWSANLCHQLPI